MRITVLTLGSRGDVQPYVALALGLKKAGHEITFAATPGFKDFVTDFGLDFVPLEGDVRAVLDGELGQTWLESSGNPIDFFRLYGEIARPLNERQFADAWEACRDAQGIVYAPLAFSGYHIAEKLGIPCYLAILQPILRTAKFPNLMTSSESRLGGIYNRLTYLAIEQLFWQPFRPQVNEWRQSTLGLPPIPWWGPSWRQYKNKNTVLCGVSPSVIPKPADWHENIHMRGYWFLPRPADWQPPQDLLNFLKSGEPPVYVGFGSMKGRDPEALTQTVLAALAKTGRRGILLTGWGGLGDRELPETVFKIDSIPHDWLFPQMAAVVHHGGAGTTAAGLRSGVPSIVAPFFADQPFWGRKVVELGVGPQPIPQSELTVEALAAAIQEATTDEGMRHRARELGDRIQAEDGVGAAVEAFERSISPSVAMAASI